MKTLDKVQENNAIFASELSQHFYFGDFYDLESSDLCFLYILQILSREGKTLSQLIKPFEKYYHSGEINFEVENKDFILKKLEEKYKREALSVSHLDGLYMKFIWGWFNVRKSNTEPVLRLNLEAREDSVMKEKLVEVKQAFNN